MPNSIATYDSTKVERLKHLLNSCKEKGKAKYYEIFVDILKVVEKTDDPAEFDSYLDYMDDDTKELKIVIYNTANSPRNDQYTFQLKANEQQPEKKQPDELSGVDISTRIDEKLDVERKKWEMDLLTKECEQLKEKVKEAEEYIEKLEQAYQEAKEQKFKVGNVNFGELASVALEGLIRRNTKLITKLPGGEALAGAIEEDNKEKEKALAEPQYETEATFKKKEPEQPAQVSPEDKGRLDVLKLMEEKFNEEQLKSVWSILGCLANNHSQIIPVLELLEPETEKKPTKQTQTPQNPNDHDEVQL